MRDSFIKRFAVIFSVLVLLQECQGRTYLQELDNYHMTEDPIFEDGMSDSLDSEPEVLNLPDIKIKPIRDGVIEAEDSLPSKGLSTYESNNQQKRWAGVALLFIGGASAAVDIYKAVRGCQDAAPNLNSNIRKAKVLQQQAIAKKDQINLDWNPIVTKELFFSKLGNSMTILRVAVVKLDSLQGDIVNLLDSSVFSKIDLERRKIENAIDRNNESAIANPDAFEDRFFTPLSLALSLSIKLAPLALWLGSKTIFPKIGKAISKKFAGRWANNNPGKMTKMFNNFKSKGLFPKARANFKAWLGRMPQFNKIKSAFKFSQKTELRLQKVKGGLVQFGQGALVGLFLAYEIYNTFNYVKGCKDKEKRSYDMLTDLEKSIHNMTLIKDRMTVLDNDVKSNYTKMLNQFKTEEFGTFVAEVRDTAKNAQTQTQHLETAAQKLQTFLDQINNTVSNGVINYNKVETLVESLLDGFGKTNFKLDCYRKKLTIIATITSNCANGIGNYESLWTDAKKLEGTTLKNCIENQNYLSKSEVQNVIRGFMQVEKKSEICIRNNPSKQSLVCNNWYEDVDDITNQGKVKDVTLDDVKYFIGKCPPGDVSANMRAGICEKKVQKKTISDVLTEYAKYNQDQLKKVYGDCALTVLQKENICNEKKNGQALPYVQNLYSLYKPSTIKNVFDNCVYTMSPADKARICVMAKWVTQGKVDHAAHADDVKLFGRAAMEAFLPSCLKKDSSSPNAEDNKEKVLAKLSDILGLRK